MKTHDSDLIRQAIRHLLDGPLANQDRIHIAATAVTAGKMPLGIHCHDTWELFCPVRGNLRFVTADRPPIVIAPRNLLIVPPGCLHMRIDLLPQPKSLSVVVMCLPGTEFINGDISIGDLNHRTHLTMSALDRAAWTTCLGNTPGHFMEQIVTAAEAGNWGRERALGLLRALIAAYAEVNTHPRHSRMSRDTRRIAGAELFLQSHYFDPALTVADVAAAVGLSASHLGFLFQKETGRTLHQALIDLRLRRATDLLASTTLSIKEIAALTGWANQLYFSTAYRRRHGHPPSASRASRK